MTARGLFITMEGGEGVGKSTNLSFLEQQLKSHGIDIMVTREPGGSRLGEDLRHLLLEVRDETVDSMAELLLMFAARAQHIKTRIEPALAAGVWVLCDRFTDATFAYQCGGRGIDRNAVSTLETLVQGRLRPDCTLLLRWQSVWPGRKTGECSTALSRRSAIFMSGCARPISRWLKAAVGATA